MSMVNNFESNEERAEWHRKMRIKVTLLGPLFYVLILFFVSQFISVPIWAFIALYLVTLLVTWTQSGKIGGAAIANNLKQEEVNSDE